MKSLLLSILILASDVLYACGFYPFGEDTRISLFDPSIFGYSAYAEFYYSCNAFAPSLDRHQAEKVAQNTAWWFDYCSKKVDSYSIEQAVYELSVDDINEQSKNKMIAYLYQQHDREALDYLRFAKHCEILNASHVDLWERGADNFSEKRAVLIGRAIDSSMKVNRVELKRRYAFVAIRLAWYNRDLDRVRSLFKSFFESARSKDILYYWSFYFNALSDDDRAGMNFKLSQVFANAVDKRFVCHQHFQSEITLEQTLSFAHSDKEKANVYLLHGVERPDKALLYLRKMYALNSGSEGLSFMLLREINKIEDYVFTPYYTLFQPSLSYNFWEGRPDMTSRQTIDRAERDRLYASEVLQFVGSVDLKKVENPFFWQCCKAYLQFITRDYEDCLALVARLELLTKDKAVINQLQMIKALALVAKQEKETAVLPAEIHPTLVFNKRNAQFIFAIGKELEYLGNTTEAALLYADINHFGENNEVVFWKAMSKRRNTYGDYFYDWFDYVDAVYTPEQTLGLINVIKKGDRDSMNPLAASRFDVLKEDLPRLYDLLGTKYIRQNKLEQALWAFSDLDSRYWSRNYTSWSDQNGIFYQSPFFTLKYTPDFIEKRDTIRLNKYTVTKQLIEYLKIASNPSEQNKDYYYFIIANAYYNMGIEGNVSFMRRMSGWSRSSESVIEDELEFRQSLLAKKYYLLAKQYAKSDPFKALCLRMVVRCEENRFYNRFSEWMYERDETYESFIQKNPYWRELKGRYGMYYGELASNCDYFKTYFDSRR